MLVGRRSVDVWPVRFLLRFVHFREGNSDWETAARAPVCCVRVVLRRRTNPGPAGTTANTTPFLCWRVELHNALAVWQEMVEKIRFPVSSMAAAVKVRRGLGGAQLPKDAVREDFANNGQNVTVPEYWIPNNDEDAAAPQPARWNMEHKLRVEQLRSLAWMQRQENLLRGPPDEAAEDHSGSSAASSGEPHGGTTTGPRDAYIYKRYVPMRQLFGAPTGVDVLEGVGADVMKDNFCLEFSLSARHEVYGGLLADKPGHGKTATTIGLLMADSADLSHYMPELLPKLPLRGTQGMGRQIACLPEALPLSDSRRLSDSACYKDLHGIVLRVLCRSREDLDGHLLREYGPKFITVLV